MNRSYDIAVIGSGFAGSLMAMIARRLGYSVVLIEKGIHPRVVIGESSTPLSNLFLEELAGAYDLPKLLPLTKWGSWQKAYPELSCGLKRGFSFFHHDLQSNRNSPSNAESQLFVEASPHDEIADTHWFRADFDHFLVNEARSLGVDYIDRFIIDKAERKEDLWTLKGRQASDPLITNASFLIDATGPRGFLHHALQLGELTLPEYPATSSLHCHFKDVRRISDFVGPNLNHVPFLVDDSAVHHIFDGGWLWVLRFNNGWTSAGIAANVEFARHYNLADGEAAWHRVLAQMPFVKQQFAKARPVTPFTYLPKLSFHSQSIVGDGWAMLPTAAGFTDPLLSTGFPLALLGVQRLAEALAQPGLLTTLSGRLGSYAEQTRSEQLATAKLIGGLYKNMENFPLFRSLSLLYFTAASYSETVRRLGKPELASSFLMANHPLFAPQFNRILNLACRNTGISHQQQLDKAIYELIERFDVRRLT